MAKYIWADGSGRLEIELTMEQAEQGHHSGECYDDVKALTDIPEIKEQLEKLDISLVKETLKEYGFEGEEIDRYSDKEALIRILWLACGDITDGAFEPEPD